MVTNKEKKHLAIAWGTVGLGFVIRAVYAQGFLLVPDETNYWQWSRYLAWGYHDQAPLIAWTIHLATRLLGHTELAVRLPSLVSMTVVSTYILLAAKRWFNAQVALQAVLVCQTILLFNIGGLLATADGLQGAAWAAAGYHAARAFEDNGWTQWLLGGTCFGLGLLSKYTMVLFLPCLLLFALLTASHRRRMLQVKPYAACLIGLGFFTPVVLWNAANNWNSLRHVAHLGGADQSFALHWNFLGDYLASQAALLTPLVFVLVVMAWVRILRGGHGNPWICRFLFFISFPVIAGFALLSLHSRVYGNWPGAGYVAMPILMAAFWGQGALAGNGGKKRRLWLWTLWTSFILTLTVLIHVIWPVLPIPSRADRAAGETVGWDQLGRQAGRMHQNMEAQGPAFIFGLKYQIASELAFYTPGKPRTVAINRWNRPNVYDYWWRDEDLLGQNAVGVLTDGDARTRLLEVFEKVDPPQPYAVFRPNIWEKRQSPEKLKPVHRFYLYRCYGFKGGLRWIPPTASDVRSGPQSE